LDPVDGPSELVAPEILAWYARGGETDRLESGRGKLELLRTQEIVRRHLVLPPAVVIDVGGGSGVYACWLADLGYQVHLVDPVPLHVEEARQASERQPARPLSSVAVGDARQLAQPSESADAVLLLGPLYHLTRRDDRLLALREAWRVLRPGGFVVAACITRWATMFNGFFRRLFDDPEYVRIVERDLQSGEHRDHTGRGYFTTAFFHHPRELEDEVREAGFGLVESVAVEGAPGLLANFDEWWDDPARRELLLAMVRATAREPMLWGASIHVLSVGRKN
jgi:ubiquinone/menaquinone biosynthesis C-methylase UbiE